MKLREALAFGLNHKFAVNAELLDIAKKDLTESQMAEISPLA